MALLHKILVIEDDPPILRLLRTTLKSCGYKVIEAATGKDGLQLALTNCPSVVILNCKLPDLDGLQIISSLRQSSEVPIIVLADSDEDAIPALDALADDYITKPFSKEELIARVKKAIILSAPPLSKNAIFRMDHLEVDFMENRVLLHEKEIRLAPIEFKLLSFLIKNCGKVLSPELILREVWGPGHEKDKECLRTCICSLRQKVEDVPTCPKHLVTEVGIGYRLRVS